MRREYRLFREQKSRLFTQREAEQLSGLTRNQLRKLEETDLVIPHRHSLILYNWNQLIFLRVLYNFLDDWTFKQIEAVLKACTPDSVEEIIEGIADSLSALLLVDKNGDVVFDFLKKIKFDDDLTNQGFKRSLNGALSLDNETRRIIEEVALPSSERSKISIKKQTIVIIKDVIQDLFELAEELQIEDFDLKVG